MSGCPICGIEAEIHDRVYIGQQCNLRKPLLRMFVPAHKLIMQAALWLERRMK